MIALLFFFLQFYFPGSPIFTLGLYYQTQRQNLSPYTTVLLSAMLSHWFATPFNLLILRSFFAGYLFYQQSLFDLLRPQEQLFRLMCIWNTQHIIEGLLTHQVLDKCLNQLFVSNIMLLIGLCCLAFLKSQQPVMIEKML